MHSDTVRILARPRVNRQLDRIWEYPLTVIRAPMGFGKTTALREYVREKEGELIWLPILGSGGSLAYCWNRFASLVNQKDEDLAHRLEQLGFPTDAPKLAKMVGLLCERTYRHPTLVVVDDYQLIDCQQVAALVTAVTAEQVKNLHIVLLARDLPALPVADLELRGLCLMIGQETLQFRQPEIGDYFNLMGCATNEHTLQQIARWTDGWISGVYLLLRGLRQGLPVGRGEDMNQLLETNLYSTYSAANQLFLQQLSLLNSVTPEQAIAVFEDPQAGQHLLSLARGNAFISYSSALSAYKMTDLLQDFLQEKARASGVEGAPIWRRMGRWLLARGENVQAYDYLYRADDIETILEDLDRVDAKDIRFTQFPQIHKIFDGLPHETAYRYPLATLRHVRVKALTSPPTARGDLARRLEEMEKYFLTASPMEERDRTRILGEIHNTWVFVAFNDARETVRHAERAVAYFAGRYSCIVSSDTEFTFGAPHLLYCYYTECGRLREQAEYISTHFHVLAQAVEGCGSGSEPLVLAEYALETGDFDGAQRYAQKATYLARIHHQTSIEICAAFVLSRLRLMQGKFADGERLLSQLAENVARQNSSVLNTTMELCLAYANSCFGRVEAVPVWLRENDMGTGDFLFQGVAFPYIVCMRAVLLSGAYVRLEVLCEEFRGKFSLYQNRLGFIHDYICSAVARNELYGIEAGCSDLEQALILAAPDGIVMPFGENALGILRMLRRLRCSKKIPQHFLERVTRCCEEYHRAISGLLPSSVSLTEREKEILQMLAQGLKHEEVAGALFISVPTVRYHVKNVYRKLEVNNKVSAIQKAKSMNLI